ncbi:MAG: DUF2490 domain-containing protein [Polaribacter sp.]|nr:DUF2490 domain-containing protein [Polaribacter sp.]
MHYKPVKKIKLILEQSWRLKEQARVTDEYFTELTFEYRLFDNFDLAFGARYIKENDNVGKIQGYEDHFRYQIDASYSADVGQLDVGLRVRYQNKNELGISEALGDIPSENLRFRTSFTYKIKNWPLDPEASVELFNRFQDGRNLTFNKLRFTVGTSYEIKKIGKFEIYYRYETNDNTFNLEQLDVLGLGYVYKIN